MADAVTVPRLQLPKDQCGEDGHRAEEEKPEERIRSDDGVAEGAGEEDEREGKEAEDRARPQRVLTEDLEDVGKEPDPGAEEDPNVKRAIADAKVLRVPNRSAIHPLTGMKTARLRV